MTWSPGAPVALSIEKPAAGGRMIARLDGQVVLVSGAIPGEQVTARIERRGKGVLYAGTVEVTGPSADRRVPFTDPLCGGCLYAHIAYPRQLEIKAQVIADAFARIGRLALPSEVRVARSPEEGYRMRARLHRREHRIGFFREGTHDICDARATRQLSAETCDALDRLGAALRSLGFDAPGEIELSESIDASQRAVCLDQADGIDVRSAAQLAAIDGLTGFGPGAVVTDTLRLGDAPAIELRRHVLAFFQGNRFLVLDLVAHVLSQLGDGDDLVDLYAGAGLFALGAAVVRGMRVTAVEGDQVAATDLVTNAAATGRPIEVVRGPVERFLETTRTPPSTLVVDPPRTGLSREAVDGTIRLRPGRIIYVSCDVATLARDSRRLVDAGYTIARLDAFDLFPNTPHVETVVVFEGRRV